MAYYDIGGLEKYMGPLEKFGGDIANRFDKLEGAYAGSKSYLAGALGSDAKAAYESLKATKNIWTIMSLDARASLGDGYEEACAEVAETVAAKYGEFAQIAADAGMPGIAQKFAGIGGALAGIYGKSLAAYFQSEGTMQFSKNMEKVAYQVRDFGDQITAQLEKMMMAIEDLGDRYGGSF